MNTWTLSYSTSIKLQEASKSCDDIILIFFDTFTDTFYGFAKLVLKGSFEGKDVIMINTEWLWKTQVIANKLGDLENPLDDNKLLSSIYLNY